MLRFAALRDFLSVLVHSFHEITLYIQTVCTFYVATSSDMQQKDRFSPNRSRLT